MKILANDGISDEGKRVLQKAGYTVITDKVPQEQIIQFIQKEQVDMLLVRSATNIRKEVIDACPSLKLLGRGGVGMDNIDVSYAKEKGLMVINTPSSSSQSVAELVMAQLYSVSRFLNDSYKNIDKEDFSVLKKRYAKGIELRGKTIGIIGFGRIGQSLASYCLASGMKVLAVDHNEKICKIPIDIDGVSPLFTEIQTHKDLNEILPKCDFLSIHVPKQSDGKAVITNKEFSLMKKGVRIVNSARGGVIDEQDLINAIDDGTVSFAALDVFENEPNPKKELLNHPQIACTPHIGAATLEAQDRIGLELADIIIQHFGKVKVMS
ncbi:MAG: 3-phosphoglycerate dehydrogenase [Flavobacteriia bacterium]|nr:3-phosphoglycerate dehydrogenase [Flavobacteriia bacterium]